MKSPETSRPPSPNPAARPGRALLAAAAAMALGSAGPGNPIGLRLTNFSMRGFDDQGRPAWELHGKRALIAGNKAVIHGVTATLHPAGAPTATTLESPVCELDRTAKDIHSDAPVHIRNPGYTLDGVGYDLLGKPQKIFIRSQVHMRLLRRDAALPELVRRKQTAARRRATPQTPAAGARAPERSPK